LAQSGAIHPKPTALGVVAAISAAPIYAQAQQTSADTLKAEARNFVKIIRGDKRKSQTYCKIVELNDQIDQQEDPIEAQVLTQKRDKLEEKLGRRYIALVTGVMSIDKDSRDYQQIASILEPLDNLCED
jgi:3-oxoacyl-ACP reductase-like protein